MEALYRDYAPRGVQFYYVYKALAHPGLRGYVRPYTLAERLAHVREARKRLRTRIPWLVDPMDNRLKHAFGDRPNSEFLIDPEGRVLVKRPWSDPDALRRDLERLVGKVDRPTDPATLDVGQLGPVVPEDRPEGLPALDVPGDLVPVRVVPKESPGGEPFYAKLWVEAERGVLAGRGGLVYLALRLDPLYRVHWNNLVGPVRLRLALPEGGERVLEAPVPRAESDSAPREFLVELKGVGRGAVVEATVVYAVCQDEQGWCKVLEQRFEVVLARDRDAGRRLERRRPARTPMVRGTVARVARQELVLRTAEGRTIKLRVGESAYVMRSGQRGTLDSLRQGEEVVVRLRGDVVAYVLVVSGAGDE